MHRSPASAALMETARRTGAGAGLLDAAAPTLTGFGRE